MIDGCSYIATRDSNDPAVDGSSAQSMLNASCSEGIRYNVSTYSNAEQTPAQTSSKDGGQVILVEF